MEEETPINAHRRPSLRKSFDETKPLLAPPPTSPSEEEEEKENNLERQGSFLGSALNLLTCAIGSGVLSLPFAFKSAGLLIGPLLLLAVATVNYYSLHLLVLCAYTTQQKTYQGVAISAFGKRFGMIFVDIVLFLTSFGALVGFTVIIGDLLRPVVCQWSGLGSDCPEDLFYVNRIFLSGVILVTCIAPLAFKHTFHEFVLSSALALASVVFIIVAVVVRSIEYLVNNPSNPLPDLLWDDAFGIIDAIPLLTFALGCHIQVIPIYSELKKSINTVSWMDRVLLTSNSTTAFLYFIVSFFGLLNFGHATEGNILNNYLYSDIFLMIGRLLMAFHVALAYPLQSWAARSVVDHLFFQSADLETDLKKKARNKRIRYALMTVGILVFAFIGAAVIPDITIIFGFIGCVGSTFANFILPGCFYLKLMPEEPLFKRIPAAVLIVVGFIVGTMGTVSLIYQTINQLTTGFE